jgi:hypothetical protein
MLGIVPAVFWNCLNRIDEIPHERLLTALRRVSIDLTQILMLSVISSTDQGGGKLRPATLTERARDYNDRSGILRRVNSSIWEG